MRVSEEINKKAISASKWSTISTVSVRMITPIIQMIMARLLVPEDFGIVTIATMVISFVQVFTDAGFQKYIIQKEFSDKKEFSDFATVAFWTNISLAIVFWMMIIIGADHIGKLLNNEESANAIRVASFGIVLYSIAGIQNAIRQREMNFKSLFKINLITIIAPAILSIPLALIGFNYWALILGNLLGGIANAIVLWKLSSWKPRFFYSFSILKKMASFSLWSMLEAIVIWLTSWIDAILISTSFNSLELGLYRNSINIVNMITTILTAPFLPVLFTALSRLKGDKEAYNTFFENTQKYMGYILLPAGVGIYLFRDIICTIALGDGWNGAADIIGLWGIASCIVALFSMVGEVYRSMGIPKETVKVSIVHLIFLVPVCSISSIFGFGALVFFRTIIRFQTIPFHLYNLKKLRGITIGKILKNLKYSIFATVVMIGGYIILNSINRNKTIMIAIFNILVCMVCYFSTLLYLDKDTLENIKKYVVRG